MAAARVNANLTQAEMAKLVGVSKNLIINWEKGRTYPNKEQFMKYCSACGCSPSDVNAKFLTLKGA